MEIENPVSSVDTPNGAYYQQDFNLEAVDIIANSGETIKLKNLVTELSFFEDIYSFSVSGYVILRDAVGLIEKLSLDGNEFIQITYGKTKTQREENKNSRKYRVYKVGDRRPIANFNSEFFTIFFCSEALLLSEQIKIRKSYPKRQIATIKGTKEGIINDILYNQLRIPENRIVRLEESYGVYDFVVPTLKPFEAISWLSTYARPKDTQIGADMLFFETNDGYFFRSLQSMYRDAPYKTYKFQPKNVSPNTDPGEFENGIVTVLDIQFLKTFDVLNETSSGTYANKLITIDPLTKSFRVTNYSYEKDYLLNNGKNRPATLNENPPLGPGRNRLGIPQTAAYDSTVKVAFSNANQSFAPFIKDSEGSVAQDIFIETYVPYRTAQISLANYTVLKLLIPGDSTITAGRTINLNIYSLGTDENGLRKLDNYFSGKYLVTAVRHIMQSTGTYQTILEIAKESSKKPISSPNLSSSSYQKELRES